MVQELVQILKKYDALDRFGLTLLHEHLPLAEDEIMMETTDRAARTQIIRPVPKSTLQAPGYFASAWRLDTGEPTQGCYDFPD
ncbi:MAG TPA: hypothetical protein VEQ40_02535 [Pyrinomonadaceae bacterium]|nr:hypothetical protein [Pyrinomonadaceae bacterium]